MPAKLSEKEIQEHLNGLPGWELRAGKLYCEFLFKDFTTAFAFMAGVATVAERLNHHPEWFNVYNRVRVELFSHDLQALSEKDFQLAAAMRQLGEQLAQ